MYVSIFVFLHSPTKSIIHSFLVNEHKNTLTLSLNVRMFVFNILKCLQEFCVDTFKMYTCLLYTYVKTSVGFKIRTF